MQKSVHSNDLTSPSTWAIMWNDLHPDFQGTQANNLETIRAKYKEWQVTQIATSLRLIGADPTSEISSDVFAFASPHGSEEGISDSNTDADAALQEEAQQRRRDNLIRSGYAREYGKEV